MDKNVELHPAFFWICDDCGRDNFVRCRTLADEEVEVESLDWDDDEKQVLADWLGDGG